MMVEKEIVRSPRKGQHRVSSLCFRRHRGRGLPATEKNNNYKMALCAEHTDARGLFRLHKRKARGELDPSPPQASGFPCWVTSAGTAQVTTTALTEAAPELSDAGRKKFPRYKSTDLRATSPPSFYFQRAVNKRKHEPRRSQAHKPSTTTLRRLLLEKTQTFPASSHFPKRDLSETIQTPEQKSQS